MPLMARNSCGLKVTRVSQKLDSRVGCANFQSHILQVCHGGINTSIAPSIAVSSL
jgi:hypothetical protein